MVGLCQRFLSIILRYRCILFPFGRGDLIVAGEGPIDGWLHRKSSSSVNPTASHSWCWLWCGLSLQPLERAGFGGETAQCLNFPALCLDFLLANVPWGKVFHFPEPAFYYKPYEAGHPKELSGLLCRLERTPVGHLSADTGSRERRCYPLPLRLLCPHRCSLLTVPLLLWWLSGLWLLWAWLQKIFHSTPP